MTGSEHIQAQPCMAHATAPTHNVEARARRLPIAAHCTCIQHAETKHRHTCALRIATNTSIDAHALLPIMQLVSLSLCQHTKRLRAIFSSLTLKVHPQLLSFARTSTEIDTKDFPKNNARSFTDACNRHTRKETSRSRVLCGFIATPTRN